MQKMFIKKFSIGFIFIFFKRQVQFITSHISHNTHRFLAAPKPPGKMTASWLLALSFARSVMLPLAMRADSDKTFLYKKLSKFMTFHNT